MTKITNRLNENSILITGESGVGKTVTVNRMIPSLLQENKRVLIVDIDHEYTKTVASLGGTTINADDIENVEACVKLLHIKMETLFTSEIDSKFQNLLNLHFQRLLLEQIASFDYLIIDEAQKFLECRDTSLMDEKFFEELHSLMPFEEFVDKAIEKNKDIVFILVLQDVDTFTEEQSKYLNSMFTNNLEIKRK